MIESSLVYRKRANPSRVDEVAAPRRDLDSKKCSVCSRSGAQWGFTPHKRYQVFALAKTCIK